MEIDAFAGSPHIRLRNNNKQSSLACRGKGCFYYHSTRFFMAAHVRVETQCRDLKSFFAADTRSHVEGVDYCWAVTALWDPFFIALRLLMVNFIN